MFALAAGRLREAQELVPQAFAFALGKRALPDVAIPIFLLQCHALHDVQGHLEGSERSRRFRTAPVPQGSGKAMRTIDEYRLGIVSLPLEADR